MCLSVFLAQVIGIYLCLVSLSALIHKDRFLVIANDFLKSPCLIWISGACSVLFGLLILVPHHIWVLQWPVVITILGWLILIQGIIRLFFHAHFENMANKLLTHKKFLLIAWIFFLIGAYLTWVGFTH